ncbi:hypothetical protein M404DRAFT_22264 [Pisolithus tinctorius Marx 270]|uniref:Uncharacterized protein n=1 Tax=Pisolithus tinctorius Marx 270 TaxID=870435 RepID=A0A0C3P6T7_PISTI|nr:hypothetical protein M404DRAFT_22264 [Pisolithus tinctorius Marx 270]
MPTVLSHPLPRVDVLGFPSPRSLYLTSPSTLHSTTPSSINAPPFDPEPALRSSNLSPTLINIPETPHSQLSCTFFITSSPRFSTPPKPSS